MPVETSTMGKIATALEEAGEAGLKALETLGGAKKPIAEAPVRKESLHTAAAPPAPAAPAVPGPTGAQINSAITAVFPALAAIQAAMASPQFQDAIIVSEDIEQILANFIPGAAAVESAEETAVAVAPAIIADAQVAWPFVQPFISGWLASGAFSTTTNPFLVPGEGGNIGKTGII